LSLLHNWNILIKENHDIFIKELYFLHVCQLFSCSRTIIIIHFVELILHDLSAKRRDIIQKKINDVSNSYQKRNDRKKIYIYIYQFFNIALLSSWIIVLEIHSNDLIFIVSTSFISIIWYSMSRRHIFIILQLSCSFIIIHIVIQWTRLIVN
jgi:hypothetical protein